MTSADDIFRCISFLGALMVKATSFLFFPCADPESLSEGANFDGFFLFDEGREDPNNTISGQSSAHQRNTIKWLFAGVPMMAQH